MTKPRVSTLLLVIAFLTSAVAAANFYVARNTELARRIRTEDLLQQVTQAKEALQAEKEELVKAKEALDEQVAQLTTRAKEVEGQFIQEKRAKEALTAELVQVRKETTQVKSQLDGERKAKQAVSDELSKAKQSYAAVSNELTTLRQAKEALEKRVKEMLAARAKEAEQIVVTPPAASTAVAPVPPSTKPALSLPKGSGQTESTAAGKAAVRGEPVGPRTAGKTAGEGKVLVVNREYGFIVVSLGSKDGIRKGSRFTVIRGDKTVATAEADKIYDNMSAANLLEEEKKIDVKEGDVVRPAA